MTKRGFANRLRVGKAKSNEVLVDKMKSRKGKEIDPDPKFDSFLNALGLPLISEIRFYSKGQ